MYIIFTSLSLFIYIYIHLFECHSLLLIYKRLSLYIDYCKVIDFWESILNLHIPDKINIRRCCTVGCYCVTAQLFLLSEQFAINHLIKYRFALLNCLLPGKWSGEHLSQIGRAVAQCMTVLHNGELILWSSGDSNIKHLSEIERMPQQLSMDILVLQYYYSERRWLSFTK